jgi:hypothetical protein
MPTLRPAQTACPGASKAAVAGTGSATRPAKVLIEPGTNRHRCWEKAWLTTGSCRHRRCYAAASRTRPAEPPAASYTLRSIPRRSQRRRQSRRSGMTVAAASERPFRAPYLMYEEIHAAVQAALCAGKRRLTLLSVTGFPVSLHPRLAEFADVDRPAEVWPSLAPGSPPRPVRGRCGRPSLATAMYKYSGRPTIRWARNRDCQVASDA